MIILLTVRLIKKVIQMGQYFFKPKTSWVNRKVELDLFNHASKAVLKNARGVNTSKFTI